MSSQFVLLDRRMSVLKKLPEAFRVESYKIFAQSPRIKKNWFFERKSPKMFFWTRILGFSTLPEIIQPNWKNYSIVQNYVFFQNIPVVTEEAGMAILPSVFLLGVKTWWKSENCFIQSSFSSKMFLWRCWMLAWQRCRFRLKLRKSFT